MCAKLLWNTAIFMNDDMLEIPLKGGNTAESVVRVGNTVRRSTRESSPTVHRLLQFLETNGFAQAPRFLGLDRKNREILSYIEGRCEIASNVWSSKQILESAARMLRSMHDMTANYPETEKDSWAYSYPDRSRHEVICHNDFGLYNLIINQDCCSGVIDFDLAGPGPRLRDVAYAAYWLVPLSMNSIDMKPFTLADIKNQHKRMRTFCTTYGIEFNSQLLSMVSEVLHHMCDEGVMLELFGENTTKKLKLEGHLKHWSMEASSFDKHRAIFENVIGSKGSY